MTKHYYSTLFLLFIALGIQPVNLKATTCTSVANGNWAAPATWSCGAKPTCGDTVYINHTVTVNGNEDYRACSTPIFIIVRSGGNLKFADGSRLRLPCNSGVALETGGTLTTNSYNGNSEELEMGGGSSGCSVTPLWQSSNGPQSGPIVFGTTLPVELLSFDVYYNGQEADITWSTATETNNDYFTIERSSDGISFEFVGLTDGAGHSISRLDYFEKDYIPLQGTSYYRLKQTDYDGNSSYSHLVTLKNYAQLSGEIQFYPNPNDGAFHLMVSGLGDEEFLLVIRDLAGKEVYSKVFIASTDFHIEDIDASTKLAAGTYVITASYSNECTTQKLVVR